MSTVRDDANRWLFDASWGVDAAISVASALIDLIENASRTPFYPGAAGGSR